MNVDAQALGRQPDALQRRAQVLLDVDGQCPQRRDVEHAAAALALGWRFTYELIDAP